MKSKTIIISSPDGEKQGRGILTLFQEDDLLKCRLRLYNIPKLSRFCKLGIYHQNEVFSANLLEKNGSYTSSLVGNFDIDKDFYTAIVDTSNNNNVLLSGGTYAGYFFNDQSDVFLNIEKENPNTNIYNYDDFTLSDSEETTDNKSFSQNEYTHCHTEQSETKSSVSPKGQGDSSTALRSAKISQNRILRVSSPTLHSAQNDTSRCAHCKYKEFFYSCQLEKTEVETTNQNTQKIENEVCELNEQTIKDSELRLCHTERSETEPSVSSNEKISLSLGDPSTNAQGDIKNSLIPQFQYVFENYQADEILNNLIPNSKFVKIDENQEQYSIGAIYENEEMKFICYAVLKDYNTPAPQELGPHYQWLPLDKEDPLSEGYYIVFQDANDLKIVEM